MTYRAIAGMPLNIWRDIVHRSENMLSAERFGVAGDGVVDDTDRLQQAVTTCIAEGKSLYLPPPRASYRVTSTITGDGPCAIYGGDRDTTVIQLVTSGDVLFDWTGNGLELHNLTLKGDGFTAGASSTTDTTEIAVQVAGADETSYVETFKANNLRIKNWGGFGFHLTYLKQFEIVNCVIHDMGYSGGHTFSCEDGTVQGNHVYDIHGTNANQYGFSFTRTSSTDLTTYPRSKRIACVGNVIRDVTKWEGLDTHSGEHITFANNTIEGCKIGINVGDTGVAAATEPYGVTVTGNSIVSGVSDGSARQGIIFHGAGSTQGSPLGLASGSIVGNYIQEHGNSNGSSEGGIYVYNTVGLTISGNSIWRCSHSGIMLDFDNHGISITGNSIIDPWSDNSGDAHGILIENGYNNGIISGNSIITESKSATAVLTNGVRKASGDTNLDLVIGENHISGATTDYVFNTNNTAIAKLGSVLQTHTGRTLKYTAISNGTTAVDRTHEWLSVSTSGGTVTLTLPSSHTAGDVYYVHHRSGALETNSLTLGRNGNLINGAASDYVKNTAGENNDLTIVTSNGTGWHTHTIPQ